VAPEGHDAWTENRAIAVHNHLPPDRPFHLRPSPHSGAVKFRAYAALSRAPPSRATTRGRFYTSIPNPESHEYAPLIALSPRAFTAAHLVTPLVIGSTKTIDPNPVDAQSCAHRTATQAKRVECHATQFQCPNTAQTSGIGGKAWRRYAHHCSQDTVFYEMVVRQHAACIATVEPQGIPLPEFLHEAFESYLRCSRLEHGFPRSLT
jgi:hypothetical protein